VNGTFTVHFNDQIETFNFHYLSNAPEPTTLLLFGTGLAAIGWRKYLRTERGSHRRWEAVRDKPLVRSAQSEQ